MKTRNLFPVLFLFFGFGAKGQVIDSVAVIREVDSLVQVSRNFIKQNNFDKALEANAVAEKIVLEKVGGETAAYGSVCFNYGIITGLKGNRTESEKWYLKSKSIREKVLGKEHPDYAESLNNLANLYRRTGNYEKAEAFHLETKSIRERVFGKEHPEYAASLNNLANLYHDMGNFKKAEAFHLETKNIREKALGKEHPDYAASLNNLAVLYYKMGDYKKAEVFQLECKSIREKVLGKEHPKYAGCLDNLSLLSWRTGSYEEAELIFQEFATLNQSLITKAFHHLSEGEINNYLLTLSESQSQMLSFAKMLADKKSRISQICYSNSLFYKGFLLNAVNKLKHLALSDSAATENFYTLKSYHRRLAFQYALPIAERDSALITTLEEKANTLEKELARTVAGFGDALRQVNWQAVQTQLKPGEAAIEFVHFRYSNPDPTDSTLYAALLLRPDWLAPKFIPLFEQHQLDALLAPADTQRTEYVNQLYTPAQPAVIVADDEATTLYDLFWAPLDSLLAGVKTVYYSPSGLLHRLNFDAAPRPPEGGGGVLADRYALHRLNSTRELVIPTAITPPSGQCR